MTSRTWLFTWLSGALPALAAVAFGLLAPVGCDVSTSGTGPAEDSGGDSTLPDTGLPDVAVTPDAADATNEASVEGGPDGRAETGPDAADASAEADSGPLDTGLGDVRSDALDGGADGDASDGDAGADTGADAGNVSDADSGLDAEAGPCTGVMCNGVCLPSATDCMTCAGAPLFCAWARRCVTACAACGDDAGASLAIECFACDSNGQNPRGTCEYADAGAYCLNGTYLGHYVGGATGYNCACDDAGQVCPGKTQVCERFSGGGACLTCGENASPTTDGLPCRGGGTCTAGLALCQ